jgi:hypothetical protein
MTQREDLVEGEIELPPKFFSVVYSQATNWGFEDQNVKFFKDYFSAKRWLEKEIKSDPNYFGEEYETVCIEDENRGKWDCWRAVGDVGDTADEEESEDVFKVGDLWVEHYEHASPTQIDRAKKDLEGTI